MALVALAPPGTAARARAVTVAAHVHGHMLGDYRAAVPFADEGLATWRALGDPHGVAVALVRRGQLAFETGDYPLADACSPKPAPSSGTSAAHPARRCRPPAG
jgi:hypothetical protein